MNIENLSYFLGKEAIKNGNSVRGNVKGYSMFPFLRKGDILIINPVPIDKILRGDIVVFEKNESWIAHRVLGVEKQNMDIRLTLKGDSNFIKDPSVTRSEYIGKVSFCKRKSKLVNLDKSNLKLWTLIIIYAPGAYAKIIRLSMNLFKPFNRI